MTNTAGTPGFDLPRKGIEVLLPLCSQDCYNRSDFENEWNMSKQFMDLLFGDYRRQVLGLLLLRPDDSLYVRQIARLTGVPPGSLHRELQSLASAGILLREPAGNQVRYRANREHPIHAELAEIFRKTSGLADVLRDALAPLGDRITTAFVFGSMARGTAVASSDVDVCVIGDVTLAQVVGAFTPLHERLGRVVNPVVMTIAEFRSQRASSDRFVSRLVKEPKLFVIGSADDPG
jgi:predicted nucleotidyltransferase